MARIRAGDVDIDDLPVAYTRGHGKPIGWHAEARCRDNEQPRASSKRGAQVSPWLAKADETYVFVDRLTPGAQLVEMALIECSLCAVQWDCAAFAVTVREPVGIWGMSFEDRTWLQDESDPVGFIRDAQAAGRPIQFAVRDAQ